MRVPYIVVAALMPAVVLAAPAGKPQTEIAGFTRNAALPKWVLPLAEIPRTERTDPVVIRLNETQALVGSVPATTINRAIQVNDSSELGVIGQYAINYFAQYQKLALHRVVILRGDQRLDRTASVSIRPLQRETNIESGMLGGATTVQLLLDDVRIGDTLWISYTIEGENPVMGKRWSSDFHWDSGSPIELRRLTVLHPRNRPLAWRQLGDFQTGQITPQIEQAGDMERIRFEERALEAVEAEPSVPSDYLPVRMLQFTEYQDWNGVANWADSLFPKAAASPALKSLARQFAAEASAEARAAAALHWVQNEVRYFSVSIGENSHRPQLPDVVLKRRYGDCKDKSYLLVSLLRELGVKAQPVLLSADAPKLAAKVLPTPTWFNHVIVQISIDGRDYYVDPTRVNQPEPLAAMPIAFPGARVLLVDPAAQALSAIPERSETLPTFEHDEEITIADFSGAATLVTRDVYRSTYADGMRVYFTRMSANEQKKSALAKYEKLYPGISLDGAPAYQDVVADNRIEITSRYKLSKAVTLKDKRYQVAFNSQILEGTLGIPSKLVRNFPFELAGGRYSGRYRLRIHWPAQVRRNDPSHLKMLDNPYFQVREEYAMRGNEVDYLMDYRLKQRSVAASELPELGEQSKLLNEFVEGSLRVDEAAVTAPSLQAYTLRDLESLRETNEVVSRMAELKGRKDQDITLAEACGYVNSQHELGDFIGAEALQLARRMEKLVMAAKPQAGLGPCKAQLSFAYGKYPAGIEALAADPLKDDASPLMRELAWAQFHAGDATAALATMARYRAAREQAAGGMTDAADAASQIALLQRAGQPLPPALEQFARELQDGPWPRTVLAMQLGLLPQEKLLQQAEALSRDSKALALNDAWFYIGQARLVAQDVDGAAQAFRWFNGNGLRNHSLTRQARRETRALLERDRHADAGMKAALAKDFPAAVAAWQQGAAAGSAASRHGLGLAALNGQGLPKSHEQALQWFQQAADQGYPESQAMAGVMYLYGMGTERDADKGLAWLRMGAEQGDANAQAELGSRYRWGRNLDQDYAQARQWLQRAADQGQVDAMAELGAMYRYGEGAAKDHGLAQFWNQRAAMYGNTGAAYQLGLSYENGEGVERDDVQAAAYYRAAAERKHADAAVNLGFLYEVGRGVKQDASEAVAWYRQAAEQGNRYGLRNLGNMYAAGLGVSRDMRLAAEYRRKAAELGSSSAMADLGYQYHIGLGVPQDYVLARGWYEKAAEQRNAVAEFNLGQLYENGLGVAANAAQALHWYRRSAEDGDLDAQYNVAQALFFGDGVTQNRAEAAEWYGKSAAQGLAAAQCKLGEMYLYGWGITIDRPRAVALLKQAAAQGYFGAYPDLGHAYEKGWGVEPDVAQAIAWYEKAPDTLTAKVRLGSLYLGAGNNAERGRRLLQEADAQTISGGFATLGRIYLSVGNKAKAEWAYLRGLDLAERAPGENDADLRAYLETVAGYFMETGQNDKAEPLIKRRLQLTEKRYAGQSPEAAEALEAMGDMYQNQGRYADADAAYQRTLEIMQALHGADSVQVAAVLRSMSGLYLAADQFDQALAFARRAQALNEALNDPALQATLRDLSAIMLAKGDYAAAEDYAQRSLALQEKKLGPDSPRLASTLNTLAVIHDKAHAYDKASAALERAIRVEGSKLDMVPMLLAVYQTNLANIRIGQKKYAEAETLLQEAQVTKIRLLGDNHPELSFGLYSQGLLYKSQQQYARAQAPLQRALALREGVSSYSGSLTAEVLQELGEVYLAQGMNEQAGQMLSRALAIRSKIMDERHPALKATRQSLAELQRKTGRA
jgi:TPR repeat protein/transglutaminase-like putative cysteine protease/uncharacterized protein (DUF2164 family)